MSLIPTYTNTDYQEKIRQIVLCAAKIQLELLSKSSAVRQQSQLRHTAVSLARSRQLVRAAMQDDIIVCFESLVKCLVLRLHETITIFVNVQGGLEVLEQFTAGPS